MQRRKDDVEGTIPPAVQSEMSRHDFALSKLQRITLLREIGPDARPCDTRYTRWRERFGRTKSIYSDKSPLISDRLSPRR